MPRIRLRRRGKKTSKLRGKRYHGYGQVSGGHRKSGQRGGFGRAGVKDHRKIELLREGHEFGSRGFTHHSPFRYTVAVNVGRLAELVQSGRLEHTEEGGVKVVDLRQFRYLRVLGGGKIDFPLKLIIASTAHVTKRAEEKIKAAGGEISIAE